MKADFLIVTALEKEAKAVVTRLENCKIERFEDKDIRTYHCGTIPIQGTNNVYNVVVVLLPSIGEISAANAVTDAIACWNPRFVLMVGIAGGIPQDDLDLGDVVVADQIIGYEYGKVTPHGIQPRDRVYPASALLLDRLRNFWDKSWTQQINVTRPGNAIRQVSKRFIGPIASGNKVIASTKFRQRLKKRWPKLIALEMEGEGVFAAVFDRPQIRNTLVIRGICDMADERKSDEWQEYAANAAAAFTVSFLKSEPVQPQVPPLKEYPLIKKEKIFLSKLPTTKSYLFGREEELKILGNAWLEPHTHILSLVAWGGVGKTALVNEWLNQMEHDNYRGAERVYGWSFYSQGTREDRQASADTFLADALAWFGYEGDPPKSPWDKGKQLAFLIRQKPALLILDGLEPLQYPPGEMQGELRDKGIQALVKELARSNNGLCIITTRCEVKDIEHTVGKSTQRICLENLSDEAGAQLLKHLDVVGTDAELLQASREFAGHALALNLLGSYLATVHEGEIRKRDLIPKLTAEEEEGGHAKRVMESYEIWLKDTPELDILYLMGLFDRPAPGGAIEVLRVQPPIKGLTDALQNISKTKWQYAVSRLRELHLLAEKDKHTPDTLDCHPLIREHFAEKLKAKSEQAWKKAHGRLYDYYKNVPEKELPDTLEEIEPLFAAVAHGCQAGLHQEVFDNVYWKRINRSGNYYTFYKLGAFGSDLAALHNFFEKPWSEVNVSLKVKYIALSLSIAGFGLRALGRLQEATRSMKAAVENFIEQKITEK